ncbi:hypothetical protein F5Y10DRAFT_231535 [Nemania abortiva]|nr:hypothetical protein F5Y10DRAFT_231535 [Nemania abortiva]
MEETHMHINQEDQLKLYANRKPLVVDRTLDDADLETRCPLDNARPHSTQPRYSVGQLDVLPLETITDILLILDLPTLTTFRRVNRRAMSLVNSLHQYSMVLKHCPNVIRAIISINANSFDCATLYKVLSTKKCEECDQFGSYLYLITCKRVCYLCFTTLIQYRPPSFDQVARHTSGLKEKHLPCVLNLPGRYTQYARSLTERTLFFDRRVLSDRRVSFAGDTDDTLAQYDLRMQQRGLPSIETARFVSIISAPYLGSSGQSADWGFYCVRCGMSKERVAHFRIKYTKDDILDHFKRHGAIPVVDGSTGDTPSNTSAFSTTGNINA